MKVKGLEKVCGSYVDVVAKGVCYRKVAFGGYAGRGIKWKAYRDNLLVAEADTLEMVVAVARASTIACVCA